MARLPLLIALSITFSAAAAQFELADVHPSAPASPWEQSALREPVLGTRTGHIRAGRYDLHAVTLIDLISTAYAIDPVKLIGGPSSIDTARFDIIAQVPVDTPESSIPAMLQSLLADRFHLRTHPDTQLFPELVLTSRLHHLLKAAEKTIDSGCKPVQAGIACHNVTMAQFTELLPQFSRDYLQGNEVIDQTGLQGAFDFTLHWTPRNQLAAAPADGIPLAGAIEKQLGLNLAIHDVPEPVVIVDQADLTPTPNVSAIPELPFAFEVVVIKPTAPDVTERRFRIERSGRVELQGLTLKWLIKLAWDIADLDAIDNEDLLVGAPKSSESTRYDIVATAPAAVAVDRDSVRLMLRKLLADRFSLTTHIESRTIPVLALVAVRPRLQPAAPRSRSGCRDTPPQQQSGTTAIPIFSVTCRNTSMAQLAPKLQAFAGRYVTHPSIDATGLKGAYDFTMSWSPPHLVDSTTPQDPNGSISLVEALDKQLGIKLRLEKRPMPVIVIDHLNPAPTQN